MLENIDTTQTTNTTIGELIATFYAEFLEIYDDEELAAAGTAVLVEKLLNGVSA
ncbi:MAG: hypothetical protein ACI9WU_000910 [Myxococcota bacterium]|jgi:hypothetical protein